MVKPALLTERSRISLGMVGVLAGLVFSVGMAWARVSTLEIRNEKQEVRIDKMMDLLSEVNNRLYRLEGAQGIKSTPPSKVDD